MPSAGIDLDSLDDLAGQHAAVFGMLPDFRKAAYVPGEGSHTVPSRVMVIGEAPSAQEAVERRPFVGPSGMAQRDLMGIGGLFSTPSSCGPPYEPNAWLTNVIKFRPPKNRNPTEQEIDLAVPLLVQEWKAIGQPRVIVAVGKVALRAVTGKWWPILEVSGKVMQPTSREGVPMYVWAMIHPSFAIRQPALQPLVEKDWEKFGEWFKGYAG